MTEKRLFKITLNVKPCGKGRPRFVRQTGRTYTPEKTASAEAEIRWLLQQANAPRFEGPVYLLVKAFFERPKSAKRRQHPSVKPDMSNVLKLIEDAANGILYKDDAQICMMTGIKAYGEAPERLELIVGEM